MAGFLGMRGTGDWTTDERPKRFREGILYLYPNGMAPLTAILSKMSDEKIDDPEFSWFTETLPTQAATPTGIYTNSAMSTAYVSSGTAGQTLWVKMVEASVKEFRVGHTVIMRYTSDYNVDVMAKVTDTQVNGANSFVAVKLLEADDNSDNFDLSDCDRILIVGNSNTEGGSSPDAVSYDVTKIYNYTQIWKDTLEITRTMKMTKLRTGDAYKRLKQRTLELHSIGMEKSAIWGIPTENVGSNGKFERTTGGLIYAIKTYAPNNVVDYMTDTTYAGDSWLTGGEEWLDSKLEAIFRYGSKEKLAFCGTGALLGINRLVKNGGNFDFSAKTKAYGIQVIEWVTAFGIINLVTHPLFSHEVTNRHSMVVLEPKNIKFNYITDTTFQEDIGDKDFDGNKDQYLTEGGFEYHFPEGWGYLNNVGKDNELAGS